MIFQKICSILFFSNPFQMTPGKSYTGKTLSWTILIAWGTEENVEFFFPRLSLGPGATGGRAPGSDLLSLPPQPSMS